MVSRGISGLFLMWILVALAACGGSSTPTQQNASLSYPSGAQTFTVGTAIMPVKPTITGSLNGFGANSQLPAGLGVDPDTGIISGTPTAVSPTKTYTVTGFVSGGTNVSATVTITVNDVAPKVSYAMSNLTYSAGLPGTALQPSTSGGGAVVNWSINPALPTGLEFNTTNGSISGTPTAAVASGQYVVTAQNSGGVAHVTLTVEVDTAPLLHLGHQAGVTYIRRTATNILSEDRLGFWILWNYASGSIVAHGASDCAVGVCNFRCPYSTCNGSPTLDMAGTTAVIVTPTGFEVHSTTDGSILSTIASPIDISGSAPSWWLLATDGSYIAVGSSSGVSAWSPSGQQLFSNSGDYSKAVAFAASGQLLVGGGAAGANVIETIAVPSGSSTTSAPFNGTFASWFANGTNFIATAGTTALIYSNAGVQQGTLTSINSSYQVAGEGNWVWTYNPDGFPPVMNIYPANGSNPAPAASYTLSTGVLESPPIVSGQTIGVVVPYAFSVVDLSGTTPTKTDYSGVSGGAYAAVSASQWVTESSGGVLVDGASLGTTPRYFGLGIVSAIAGGSGHIAIAMPSAIMYFNAATLAPEGQIPFSAGQLAMSSDGTVLAAMGVNGSSGLVNVYSLPAGTLLNSQSQSVGDINLSGSGTVLSEESSAARTSISVTFSVEASPATGGSPIFSNTFTTPKPYFLPPPVRISPDGTLIAYSPMGSPTSTTFYNAPASTNLLLNGSLLTAFKGLTVGWLDNTRLMVNNYTTDKTDNLYSSCALYGPTGSPMNAPCAIPVELTRFQPIAGQSDLIYAPQFNQVFSVSTGTINWASGNAAVGAGSVQGPGGALAGSNAIFVSGIDLVAQSSY